MVSFVVAGFVTAGLWFATGAGVNVFVSNDSGFHLRDVILHASEQSIVIGDIPARGVRSVRVNPRGECHFEIEFTDSKAMRRRVDAGGYVEHNYRGQFLITVKEDGTVHVTDQTKLPWY